MNFLGRYLASLVPGALILGAIFTNPSRGDFERYMRNELGILQVGTYHRSNFIVCSRYVSDTYSLSRGHDRRVIVGAFGSFAELSQDSTW